MITIDTDLDFGFNDEYICNNAAINAIKSYEPCFECRSHDHTHRECPHMEVVHYTDDSSEKGFECLFS